MQAWLRKIGMDTCFFKTQWHIGLYFTILVVNFWHIGYFM